MYHACATGPMRFMGRAWDGVATGGGRVRWRKSGGESWGSYFSWRFDEWSCLGLSVGPAPVKPQVAATATAAASSSAPTSSPRRRAAGRSVGRSPGPGRAYPLSECPGGVKQGPAGPQAPSAAAQVKRRLHSTTYLTRHASERARPNYSLLLLLLPTTTSSRQPLNTIVAHVLSRRPPARSLALTRPTLTPPTPTSRGGSIAAVPRVPEIQRHARPLPHTTAFRSRRPPSSFEFAHSTTPLCPDLQIPRFNSRPSAPACPHLVAAFPRSRHNRRDGFSDVAGQGPAPDAPRQIHPRRRQRSPEMD